MQTNEVNMYNVAVFVGSLRKESINKKLADNLAELSKDFLTLKQVRLDDVPIFNQDLENDLPEPVVRLKSEAAEADAVLFVTPEYNRGVPAVLKNAVDWCGRPQGTSIWRGKPASLCGISTGAIGTAVAQSQLRNTMLMLGMAVFSFPEIYLTAKQDFFDEGGHIANAGTQKFLTGYLEGFAQWIKTNHA
jgi:chromate reductase